MARMSREFSLVLLGAGLLTAGFFLAPESDPVQKASDEATGGADTKSDSQASGSGRRRRVRYLILYHSTASPSRAFATSSTVRGGFGRSGARIVGG